MIKYKVVTIEKKSIIVPTGSKYCLTYKKGIVKALPETIGIMVFKSLYFAKEFNTSLHGEIIKVRPIGKKKFVPSYIVSIAHDASETTRMIKKFNLSQSVFVIPIPIGTECYEAVEIL